MAREGAATAQQAMREAYLARVRASLEDVRAGRVKKFKTADDLLKALDADEPA